MVTRVSLFVVGIIIANQSSIGTAFVPLRSSWEVRTVYTQGDLHSAVASVEDDVECVPTALLPCWMQKSLNVKLAEKPSEALEMPPWLQKYKAYTSDDVGNELGWLEYNLLEYGYDKADIQKITSLLCSIGRQDTQLIIGAIDFLRMMLSISEEGMNEFLTVPVLLASVLHYAECVAARQEGVADFIANGVHHDFSSDQSSSGYLQLNTSLFGDGSKKSGTGVSYGLAREVPLSRKQEPYPVVDSEVIAIARSAARIKRAEILADVVQGNDRVLTAEEASRLRGWLLSTMDDWRSLAIRVFASLYRLRGLGDSVDVQNPSYRTPQAVRVARESMRVYSILAGRLGMHRLKSSLQEGAFRVLYQRQYQAVSSLYRQSGGDMLAISHILRRHITKILEEDDTLLSQLDYIHVASRVKEPFSFWRKMLKKKATGQLPNRDTSTFDIREVQDGVALRVIVQARKLAEYESEDAVRAREHFLCYYVQQLIRSKWPEIDASRIKDYIYRPKPNGYQSLHHTSSIMFRGYQYPFEVQVRTDEMHKAAEFGLAAHWDYKLGNQLSLQDTISELSETFELPGLLEESASGESYVDALVSAKDELSDKQVYVFVVGGKEDVQGKLVSLPADSRLGDVMVALQSVDVGDAKVWLNGNAASLSDRVINGDVVMVAV
jgi:ppGpp synthetase/RelA/SpoT-type nucleotidyltranferase